VDVDVGPGDGGTCPSTSDSCIELSCALFSGICVRPILAGTG